jgi:hypothetical protein
MSSAAPPVPPASGGGTLIQQIGNLIRHWVHYDDTITDLNKQLKTARDTRKSYETNILHMLKATNMVSPVIQIVGGRIIVGEDKQQESLNYTNISSILHQYYAKKPGARDETDDIMKFIKANREIHSTPCLKRQGAARSRSRSSKDRET